METIFETSQKKDAVIYKNVDKEIAPHKHYPVKSSIDQNE